VSPIFGVIILIGIAIAGGVFLSNTQNQFLNTTLYDIEYAVTDLRLEKDSKGLCYFFAKLRNSGTDPIVLTKINATLDSGQTWSPSHSLLTSDVQPGKTLDLFMQFSGNECGNFTISNTYSAGIEASSGSSSYKTIVPLKVEGVKG
jgi:hypothetical protein